ncbi:alpha/beta-hydrolase [Myriangium duriaei CBS 260.36]|uniref:Alpha/beta-hydrolase n=1 Tax=Myriangium duriaei CBS 260.36 TaxID=1168546 RepID=A0A9P4MEK6_9PEZI|nr:alpha/beta-hydrolase [Myriangium duriaei CBS 260.36]
MILDQISYLDCLVFLVFLFPQLLIQVNFVELATCGLQTLPFLLLQMPYALITERYFTEKTRQSPFVQHATLFQDIVIRCVRYAFAKIPAIIGKVFFSKGVALPFFHFRRLRHGIIRSPIHWEEVNVPGLKGIWAIENATQDPDIVIYYCHGGGFSMGSSYFYLEFLLAWVSILSEVGYRNPALFALEYTLVPTATFPQQIHEARRGYDFVLSRAPSPDNIVVGGDSAGATLMLSLLLSLAESPTSRHKIPGLATLISPWTTIVSPNNRDTPSDYLNADSLHLYGRQYLGEKASDEDSVASPGTCADLGWWRRATPSKGWFFIYGTEEVFAPEARKMVRVLTKADAEVGVHEEPGWIHAWPVVKLFLCDSQPERQSGLRSIVQTIQARIPPEP